MRTIVATIAATLLPLAALTAFPVQAQSYPERTIKMIVPYSPGTGIDILARTVGQRLTARMGQPVVVENQAGASGTIATVRAAQSKPDGYTLLMMVSGHVINPHVYKGSVNYDPIKDFTPITLTAWGRLLLVVHPGTQITSVAAFIERAKAQPGKLTYGTPGPGTPHHLAMELLRGVTGIDLLHVPYSGTAGALTGMLSGTVDSMFLPIHVAMPHVRSGKLTVLGLGSAHRSATTPDIPTLAEQGVPGAEVDMFYGLLAPAGLPRDIAQSLNSAVVQALKDPEMRSTLEKQGLEPETSTPEAFRSLMQRESEKWGKVVERAKIKADSGTPSSVRIAALREIARP